MSELQPSAPLDSGRSLRELRTLLATVPVAVAMLDEDARFLWQSPAWEERFEANGRELFGCRYDDECEAVLPLAAALGRVLGTGRAERLDEVDMQARGLFGPRVVVCAEIRPWFSEQGRLGGVVVQLHEVTAMIETQVALRRAYEELTQFNYRASHDIIAPLRTIRGLLGVCHRQLDRGDTEAVRALHGKMVESIDALSSVVQDVLDLSRADLDHCDAVELSLGELAAEMLAKHREGIDEAEIEVRLCLERDGVHTERLRLLQIIETLVSNAVKYHDPRKPARWIEVQSWSDDGQLVLRVADNGIGFDPALGDHIFHIFKRGSSERPGAGLGLYLARKHADALGGSVRVVSARDDTIFEVRLPGSAR